MMKFKQIIHKFYEDGFPSIFFYCGSLFLYISFEVEGIATFFLAILAALLFNISVMLIKKSRHIFLLDDESIKALKEFVEEHENHKSQL